MYRARSPILSKNLTIKRCAKSAGSSLVERRSSRGNSSLVLDLRPWKSFDNVSNITDGQHDGIDNLEVIFKQDKFDCITVPGGP